MSPSIPDRGNKLQSSSKKDLKVETKRISDAIEAISYGLVILDEVDFSKTLHGNSLIDATARLNAQNNRIKDIVEPLKNRIKAENLRVNAGSNASEFAAKGDTYMAIIQKVPKTVLRLEEVKKFLGRKLGQFQTVRTDVTIRFEVKE